MKLLLGLLLAAPCLGQSYLYVDANLTTGANDGSSWDNAFQGPGGLKQATDLASGHVYIYVAQGTYHPSLGTDRTDAIEIENYLRVIGGFLGGETYIHERPPFGTAPTIIDGDLLGNDHLGMYDDNSYNCVRFDLAGQVTTLDGFIVRGGNANGATHMHQNGGGAYISTSMTRIRNCHFVDNQAIGMGGGIYEETCRSAYFDTTFENNTAGDAGGGIAFVDPVIPGMVRCTLRDNEAPAGGGLSVFGSVSAVSLSDTVIHGNRATGPLGGGAAVTLAVSSMIISNCTIYDNHATQHATGGVEGLDTRVLSSILWGNQGNGGTQSTIDQIGGNPEYVLYSIVQGGFVGDGNVDSDPMFVDPASGDLRLSSGSPGIDAGTNATAPDHDFYDRIYAPRRVNDPNTPDTGNALSYDEIVDMGAYEFALGNRFYACYTSTNSTSEWAVTTAQGSLAIADNDIRLHVRDVPLHQFGYFVTSRSFASVALGDGRLCLGGPVVRLNQHVRNSGANGEVNSPNLMALQGLNFQPGETWGFQLWYRDGQSSNFSTDLWLTWE